MLAVLAPASSALAWPAVDPAGNRVPVLAGRWTVALPESTLRATPEAAPGLPPPREALDSAGLVQIPEGNFGIRGTLLESTRPEDLAAVVRTLPAPCPTPTYGTIGERTDLVAVRCVDVSPDGALRPITVYAVHPDGWVDRIETLIETTDPDDDMTRASGVEYAEAVLATLTPDAAPDAVERGTVEVARACEQDDQSDPITITLPEGWIAIRDTLGAISLLRITQVVPLAAPRAMVAIELAPSGTAPTLVPAGVGQLVHGTILETQLDWLAVEQTSVGTGVRRLTMELSVDCGSGESFARAMNLSLGGPMATLDPAQHVLETLSFGTARNHTLGVTFVSTQAPPEAEVPELASAEDREMDEQGHFWSIAIGGASLLLLAAALVMRARTTRPK